MPLSLGKMNDTTFIEITNKQIYNVLEEIKTEVTIVKGHLINLNGRVKLNRWVATTALSLSIIALGFTLGKQ